jgi:polyribonucleotide nucleotidyltransferase
MIPLDDPNFPYTLLLTSEVLESNGSTSMASVCGSTLALMDAGIQIKAPVAGIAMGLMSDGKGVFKVLTDIQGMEDFCGDMDFKVAGTRDGITALQLDTKLEGIPDEILAKALNQARDARLKILDVIEEAIPSPRTTVGDTAPTVTTIQINPEKIGAVIGPGGAVIKKITGETGASIDIQQDGRVLVGGSNGACVKEAIARIKGLTEEVAVGSEFTGKVTRIMGRGAMVEYMPGREGMVPKEHLSPKQLNRIEEAVNIGDDVSVKVFEIDHMGRVNLTALGVAQTLPTLSENEAATPPPPGERGGRGDWGRDRDRGRGGDRDRGRGGDRGDRGDRGGDRNRDAQRGERRPSSPAAPTNVESTSQSDAPISAPQVPEAFPRRDRNEDENVNARFRPRR